MLFFIRSRYLLSSKRVLIDNKINYPFKISWFGMDTNHDTLEFGIREILEYNFEAKIKIITNVILQMIIQMDS